mmetsp:Transcript_33908/g.79386  ORF Transcript_33908/g.79386 Transcript_33908/m.79386 type:complete len:258 (+) Transcript_33908:704-1477(+)
MGHRHLQPRRDALGAAADERRCLPRADRTRCERPARADRRGCGAGRDAAVPRRREFAVPLRLRCHLGQCLRGAGQPQQPALPGRLLAGRGSRAHHPQGAHRAGAGALRAERFRGRDRRGPGLHPWRADREPAHAACRDARPAALDGRDPREVHGRREPQALSCRAVWPRARRLTAPGRRGFSDAAPGPAPCRRRSQSPASGWRGRRESSPRGCGRGSAGSARPPAPPRRPRPAGTSGPARGAGSAPSTARGRPRRRP